MRHGDGGQRAHPVGVPAGQGPRHVGAPVVADDVGPRDVERRQQVRGHLGQARRRVGRHLVGPGAGGVAQLVGRVGTQPGLGEQRRHRRPRQRRLREAVQQEHRPPVLGPVDPHVEGQITDVDLLHLSRHGVDANPALPSVPVSSPRSVTAPNATSSAPTSTTCTPTSTPGCASPRSRRTPRTPPTSPTAPPGWPRRCAAPASRPSRSGPPPARPRCSPSGRAPTATPRWPSSTATTTSSRSTRRSCGTTRRSSRPWSRGPTGPSCTPGAPSTTRATSPSTCSACGPTWPPPVATPPPSPSSC